LVKDFFKRARQAICCALAEKTTKMNQLIKWPIRRLFFGMRISKKAGFFHLRCPHPS